MPADMASTVEAKSRGARLRSKIASFKGIAGGFNQKSNTLGFWPPKSDPSAPATGDINAHYTEAESEAACAKVWAIYVGEAERYDKRLVESWKGDMDGMLIFSGLYSASLTAFLVESYTTLQPDSGAISATLLLQISGQLAGPLNGTQIAFQQPAPFHPSTAALVCNTLWFLSLALSLTCALLATLVEQWAREFIHKTELRPSPARRVRIHSFLYLGLRKFGMHTVVDIIPLLLHASLIIFFAGLVFFLLPVNPLLMKLMSAVLAAFLIVYITLTALPVVFLDSPYQTPLSKALWRFCQFSAAIFTGGWSKRIRRGPYSKLTITQAMERRSQDSPKIRDQHAIQWTMSSLTDDSELIPFVEAIPDIVHGAKGFHRANDYLLHPLLYTEEPHLAIWPRVVNLLRSSAIISPTDSLRIPRLTMCFRAIWALAKTGGQAVSQASPPVTFYFDRGTFRALEDPTFDSKYTISVRAAVQHKLLTDLKSHCQYVLACLDGWETASISSRRGKLQSIREALDTTLKEGEFYAGDEGYFHLDTESQDIFRALRTCYTLGIDPSRDTGPERFQEEKQKEIQTLESLRDILRSERRWANAHLGPLSWYLRDSLKMGRCPYQFDLTAEELMSCVRLGDRSAHVHSAFESLVPVSKYSVGSDDIDKMAKIVFRLLRFVDPMQFRSSMNAIYHYLLNRNPDEELYILDDDFLPDLMSAIVKDVENGPSEFRLKTIWLITAHMIARNLDQHSDIYRPFLAFTSDLWLGLPAQATVLKSDAHSFALAIVQWTGIDSLSDEIAQEDAHPSSNVDVRAVALNFRKHPLLLSFFPENADDLDASNNVFDIYSLLANQITEISLILLATFLGAYVAKDRLPYATELLVSCLERQCRPDSSGKTPIAICD
ncbi:hypothetical protein B0H17DRAFT_1191664 [Mycena rosella]|uniref:DUF6535 domain-containing protein n=1 Tax=Mycena rosella TaxID=1033263 RepID=A0AAD7MAI6_MYCRO|nr:hypothetical protein B0H17DRAFT_1191664 [Mycena rosella]